MMKSDKMKKADEAADRACGMEMKKDGPMVKKAKAKMGDSMKAQKKGK